MKVLVYDIRSILVFYILKYLFDLLLEEKAEDSKSGRELKFQKYFMHRSKSPCLLIVYSYMNDYNHCYNMTKFSKTSYMNDNLDPIAKLLVDKN